MLFLSLLSYYIRMQHNMSILELGFQNACIRKIKEGLDNSVSKRSEMTP